MIILRWRRWTAAHACFSDQTLYYSIAYDLSSLHLLYEVQPAVVDVVLGEGGDRFWSLPQRQVAVVGFADH